MQIIHEAGVWGLELRGDLALGVRTQQQHKPSDDRTQPGPQGQYTVAIQLSRWQCHHKSGPRIWGKEQWQCSPSDGEPKPKIRTQVGGATSVMVCHSQDSDPIE